MLTHFRRVSHVCCSRTSLTSARSSSSLSAASTAVRLALPAVSPFADKVFVGFTNNDIQSAGQIQDRGAVYTVKATEPNDLNRQLVKSDHCTINIPELSIEIPASRGQLTTIEGILRDMVRDLGTDQALRRVEQPEVYEKIEALLSNIRKIVPDGDEPESSSSAATPRWSPFTVRLDDPSGNSFIEARGGFSDPKWQKREYIRSNQQNAALGLTDNEAEREDVQPEEVLSFPTTCSSCGSHLETLMKTIDIPYFKEVVLMSTNCHNCGYRDNEIKSGGAISKEGRKITLKVEDSDDLSRDILKSETAGLAIPEIDLELQPGTLGGRFTTLEGILNQVYEELDDKVFARGDAAQGEDGRTLEAFLASLKQVINAERTYTVVLDDPLANSYIQNLYAPDPDPNMQIETYTRSFDQDEELGLNDIDTETYKKDLEEKLAKEEIAEAARTEP